jgi:hypothetical protein
MERSEQVGDLIAALAKAQHEFTPAIKDVTNNAFGTDRTYKYADLAANIGAVRPALSKHGIALIQFDESDLQRQTASVTTALYFGEQWISQTAEAPAVGRSGFNVQSIGACWTYLRRYTLQAICGLASEDNDAQDLVTEDNKPIPAKKGKQKEVVAAEPPAEASQDPGTSDNPPAEEPAAQPKKAATTSRSGFFLKSKELGWGLDTMKVLLKKKFGHFDTSKLSVEQMEETLKIMGTGEPDEVLANLDEPAEAA